jgi:hypothetical protein
MKNHLDAAGCAGDDRGIERIANAISQRTGEPARMIIKVAHAQARAIVEKYKSTIRRLATVLQQKRTLQLLEIDEAIRDAMNAERSESAVNKPSRQQHRAEVDRALPTKPFAFETNYRGVTIRASSQRGLDWMKRHHDELAKRGGMQTAEGG